MRTYKCPKCGNVMTEGETLYACPKCGCSTDNFIVIDEADTTSNNYSASSPEQQKSESGSNLSAQPTKDYDAICPDCNSVITNEDSDCPICGCPSNMFIKRAKVKFVHGEKLECPDCVKVFAEIIPADCPNCGCPSEKFKIHEERVPQAQSTKKRRSLRGILIMIFIIGAIGGFSYYKITGVVENARYEQYQKEKQEKEAREQEEQRRNIEKADKELFQKMTGTYVSDYFYYQGTYVKYRITLYRSGDYEIEILNDYHRVVHRGTGTWRAFSASNVIALDIDSSGNWGGAISIVGNHIRFGGVECF